MHITPHYSIDDILLFYKTDRETLRTMKLLLHSFELASTSKINFNKSSVYLLDNNEEIMEQFAQMINC